METATLELVSPPTRRKSKKPAHTPLQSPNNDRSTNKLIHKFVNGKHPSLMTAEEMKKLKLPDHTQLPCEDDTFVHNFQEHPQSILLTESIWPILENRHPNGYFAIGQDSGIYWRLTNPPDRGAIAPDWFYVPNVPPTLNGQIRRSYVLWQEIIRPLIAIEFVSDNEGREHDQTPFTGKFWIYENAIQPIYYVIYTATAARLEVYQLVAGQFQAMPVNAHGRYTIAPLGLDLGLWQGSYKNADLPWLRWWHINGEVLPTPEEQIAFQIQRAERADQRAEQADERARRFAERLRSMGIDPDEVAG